ncbi:TPA: cell envelope integrity protein CreD [Yersinia enterocolitica]|uniref:cell envelope integrity protein CreD n=1 Tax=Yersinia enterocolitica TaxID=630 RepID=UPI001CA4E788|nr:cell envelope integrity protein CreD [Yersinia enterocolitica]MBW5835257.1 cell envelope integrity protein CreD [Yersinia enterocolitica]MBX9475196.1 cell envelope integrity protein CreD [Yersinia enterocolitica]HDL8054156.1 cell envelope integrity protein CreD [Yersinia enterocolitica]HDM8436339.1 cell envelope integrity protein CreD [Yersinia enterocolitica]HEI6851693.1 cell envelope integrity protein CreD [Yersinia enterocolitica]
MFKSVLFWKIAALLGLILLMMIPKEMLLNVINERSGYRQSVVDKVSDSTSRAQKILGPLIVVPYSEWIETEVDGKKQGQRVNRHRYLLPEVMTVTGAPDVEVRQLGIYQAQVYQGELYFHGQFESSSLDDLDREGVTIGTPSLVLALSDSRGIQQISPLSLGNAKINFEPGAFLGRTAQGVHAPLTIEQVRQGKFDVNFKLTLAGTNSLSVVPVGRSSELTLQSNWPHPNFVGEFLPLQRKVDEKGFRAHWSSNWLANSMNINFSGDNVRFDFDQLPAFTTSLIEPVDHYQLTERAIKYAILFIGLTFFSFFLFESLTSLRVHPIQYLLVGAALVLFYLMLLAFSEHLGFTLAYIIASLSCSMLIAIYLSAVLGGWLRGALFASGLLLLYGVLFGLLQSEDNALLLGAGLLFIILAAVMLLTRRLDWYQVASPQRLTGQKSAESTDSEQKAEEISSDVATAGGGAQDSFRLWK